MLIRSDCHNIPSTVSTSQIDIILGYWKTICQLNQLQLLSFAELKLTMINYPFISKHVDT